MPSSPLRLFVGRRASGDLQQAMQEQMKKQMASTPDPKVQQAMQQHGRLDEHAAGMATMIVLVLIFMGVVFLFVHRSRRCAGRIDDRTPARVPLAPTHLTILRAVYHTRDVQLLRLAHCV